MVRKWPDHFEEQRLRKEHQQREARRRFEKVLQLIPKNLQDKHVKEIAWYPSTSVFVDYDVALKLHAKTIEQKDDPELLGIIEKVHTRIRSFAHNFLNLADRISEQLDDDAMMNLVYVLEALDTTKVPYELNKTLRSRILVAKLAK